MHPFNYAIPESIRELLSLLSDSRSSTRILAGGTDLIVQMRSGVVTPDLVIDVKKIPEFTCLTLSDLGLTVGAAVSCRTIYEDEAVARAYPALIDAATLIGSVQIQGRASIGGNLCNASPSADFIPALIALGANAIIQNANSKWELPVEDFCISPGKNILVDGEALVSLRLPVPLKHAGAQFLRFTPRIEMDIAVANAAASVVLSDDGKRFVSARIAIGAVAPVPLLVRQAGDHLRGKSVSTESIAAAAEIAKLAASPIDDMRGSIAQRRQLIQVLVSRALHGAIGRAKGSNP